MDAQDGIEGAEHFEFPCSHAQQRLWIDDQLAPGRSSYNIHASIQLASELDARLLERALAALIERHESLRTTFQARDGTPVQCVAAEGRCAFHVDDLGTTPQEGRPQALMALARQEAEAPFDLAQGPLLRVRLVRLDRGACVLMLTIHHIIADAWSMGVLLRDLTTLYADVAGGQAPSLPELPIQYADYAVWQRDPAQAGRLESDLGWWRGQLDGLPALELPTDHVRPPVASHAGSTLHFALNEAASGAVRELAAQQAVTPYVVLLAALAIVLQAQSGQDEVVVGAPVAGRNRPELEGLIGFFVNMIVLRLDLSGTPDVSTLLSRVQHTLQEGLAHSALPFEQLVQALQPPRDLSRNPLFQVSVQYLASPSVVGRPDQADDEASVMQVQRGAANFDLSFDFWQRDHRIEGRVDHAIDLFDATTVTRWIGQWQRVLAQMCTDPTRTLSQIDLLSPAERAQLTGPWAGLPLADTGWTSMARRWDEVVRQQPGHCAVTGPEGSLTFAQLDDLACRMGSQLMRQGVQPGDVVGLTLPRGPMQMATLLAIVKLGAAYLALDVGWPASRLQRCIALSGVRHLICSADDQAVWASLGLLTSTPEQIPDTPSPSCRTVEAPAQAPAYIAFTSGSTGQPKGVVVPQRAVLRLVCRNPAVPLDESDRILVHSPLAFDASTLEIWGSLLTGATAVLPPTGPLGLDDLADCLAAQQVSTAWLTAGLFHQLAASHAPILGRLKRLYAGGDVLSADAIRKVLTAGEGRLTVYNGYGPTENTTFTCVHAMQAGEPVPPQVPIGRPIAGTFVRVLDRWQRLAPVGVAGELLAGGHGLALGYLGDPAATSAAFVPDPLDPPSSLVYRTGDRVCWLPDGTLRFLGRADRQVKVRGFRIEPAEVEAALRTVEGVMDTHVFASADRSGDKHLVAGVAVQEGVRQEMLQQALAARLPAWMLPSEWHLLSTLALNANGKIDTDALHAHIAQKAQAAPKEGAGEEAALAGEIESLIADLWTDVLGQTVRDPNAHFFSDLGGHSLLATQIISRLNAGLQLQLPLASIFEQSTVRALAACVEARLLAELATEAV